ncbi:MAG: Sec-independent protein translocase protein TatB [Deltaproteobacteria bacterium]|nr:Sec-independent protein translocase protein TatB [Deltaproteobacteria bacterium]
MFNIGMTEMIIIGIIALVILGPSRLPGVARTIGKGLAELRRHTNEFKRTVSQELDEAAGNEIKEVKSFSEDLKLLKNRPRNIEEYLESAASVAERMDPKKKPDPDSKA